MKAKHSGNQKITIKEAISEGIAFLRQVSPSFGLDTEILLSEVIKKPREYLLAHNEEALTFQKATRYRQWLTQRFKGIPIPYITGNAYFLGRKFIVNKYVLVPRPETEALVEECVKIFAPTPSIIADIGTGSGIIAVSLAIALPKTKIVATDKSGTALKVAARNAKKYRVQKRITFFASDLLNEIPQELIPNIIVANLPYVTSDEIKHADEKADTVGLTFEPQGALNGGPDGLAVFRRFFAQIERYPYIKNNLQHLLLEHSPVQYHQLCEMAYKTLPNYRPKKITEFVTHWQTN